MQCHQSHVKILHIPLVTASFRDKDSVQSIVVISVQQLVIRTKFLVTEAVVISSIYCTCTNLHVVPLYANTLLARHMLAGLLNIPRLEFVASTLRCSQHACLALGLYVSCLLQAWVHSSCCYTKSPMFILHINIWLPVAQARGHLELPLRDYKCKALANAFGKHVGMEMPQVWKNKTYTALPCQCSCTVQL